MHRTKTFTLKKLALALAIAGYTMGSAYAVLTAPTGTIQGRAPVLSAITNSAEHAVDFAYSGGLKLMVGETISMTYIYQDQDGDLDATGSSTHITWFSTPDGGTTRNTISTGVTHNSATSVGGAGGSSLVIPVSAVGEVIGVEIVEYSASGDPISGETITVLDTSVGGGGTGVTPPGPVLPNLTSVVPGIYAASDTSFATNLIGTATTLNVGDSYVFKLWLDADGDGQPDGTAPVDDHTGDFTYNWRLVGTSATDNVTAPAGGIDTTVTDANFTVPTNTTGKLLTTSDDGVQGFNLAVDYN